MSLSRRLSIHSAAGTLAFGAFLLGGAFSARAQTTPASAPAPFARDFYPIGKAWPSPKIMVDVSDAPDARAFADNSRTLIQQWFPLVCQFLATANFKPPKTITLTFKNEQSAPAYTTGWGTNGAKISVSDKWIAAHPDDYGMVIHEMTHVIQSYPNKQYGEAGWLVEGIADYIRFYRYEPDVPRRNVEPRTPQKASYRDSYRTTAAFLAFVSNKYNRALVADLDRALRAGKYSDALFEQETGKTADALWTEFVQSLTPPAVR